MVPEPPKVLFELPVKVIPAPAVLLFVLKSKVPLLVRSPPIDSVCVVTVPELAVRKVALTTIDTFPAIVTVRAVVVSNCKIPELPCPTVRLFIVTS